MCVLYSIESYGFLLNQRFEIPSSEHSISAVKEKVISVHPSINPENMSDKQLLL